MAFEKERAGPLTYFCFIYPYFISPLFIIVINRGFKTKKNLHIEKHFCLFVFKMCCKLKKETGDKI